jgi:membrane-anchored protein YejM (alkaline phosphatase superfamily)
VQPGFVSPLSLAPLLREEPPARRPDILLVVIESLRRDALDPVTMPQLWSWSKRGLRFPDHTATSNASHYGLFALLYGRSPLFYFETLDSGERPTLPSQLRAWGYENHNLGCSDIAWRGMDRFMGSADFAVERLRGASLPACDGEVVSRAAALLSPGDRPPRFVLAFLTSTHFGYHYPEEDALFHPSIAPPNALELDPERDRAPLANRYRNSAHAVDEQLGSLLGQLDPSALFVVVTGDHGEALFDDGTIAHSSRLSDAQTAVPLVLTGPGIAPGPARPGPTDHADVLPTLLARLGAAPEVLRRLPGRDLLDEGPSPFSPLIAARARRGDDLVVLASNGPRYAWRLDGQRDAIRFLGKWGRDGRPSGEPVSEQEGAEAVRWLERYLASLGSR